MILASRWLRRATVGIGIVAAAILSAAAAAASPAKTILAVLHSDLRIIDPEFTTAYITRDHGYMVYDTLLAMAPRHLDAANKRGNVLARVGRSAEALGWKNVIDIAT